MKKINLLAIIWLLFYALIFSFLLYNSHHYLDPDLGWHLQVGKQILDEKNLPSDEYYNYTLEGKKWVDHEWPLNIATYWLYNTSSLPPNYPRGTGLIMFFQLFGVLAMAPHLGVRMQEITLLNLLLLLIILCQYTQRKNNKILLWLLPLFYFWACVHGGFLIGLLVMLLWLGIKITELIIKKINAFHFTLLTPYGLKLYSFLQEYTNTFYMKNISEWLPFYYWPIQYKQLFYSAIVSATLILLIYTSLKQVKIANSKLDKNNSSSKIDLWPFVLTFFFLLLSFKSKRHFPLLFIVSFPLLIKFYSQHLDLPDKIKTFFKKSLFIKFSLILLFHPPFAKITPVKQSVS